MEDIPSPDEQVEILNHLELVREEQAESDREYADYCDALRDLWN